MRYLYTLLILLYGVALKVAARFNQKARQWVEGRKGWLGELEKAIAKIENTKPRVWFHVSSLGEFEQGRPIIEAFRKANPGYAIVLTFFSPSGFEVRKNYDGADLVLYLPLDTPENAKKWIGIVNPRFALFVKYDFWFNFIAELRSKKIPVYFASVIFRGNQHFFSSYGGWFRRQLGNVTWFFAQNEESVNLLKSIGRHNVTLTGDTRFDRVYAIAQNKTEYPLVRKFCGEHKVFIGGSTWKEDENLILPLIPGEGSGMKFILAPHDTNPDRISSITSRLDRPYLLYSGLTDENVESSGILIIDSVGILAQLYQYATMAFIGGGFGVSIHNIQEPITFGVPVFFGPRYHKFKEAVDLIASGGAFCVESEGELKAKVNALLKDHLIYDRMSSLCRAYVDSNRGATDLIMEHININSIFGKEKQY